MTRTLRVCTYAELPSETDRNGNYLYITYDQANLYIGKNIYTKDYYVVDSAPLNPTYGVYYVIINDGTVNLYDSADPTNFLVANIEAESQKTLLTTMVSKYFESAEYKMLNLANKYVTVTYQNCIFQLAVNLNTEIQVDKTNVIYFDGSEKSFEIKSYMPNINVSGLKDIDKYKGSETNSIKTTVNIEESIASELKLSSIADNILTIKTDGLYASAADATITQDDLTSLLNLYNTYKSQLDADETTINDKIAELSNSISKDVITVSIKEQLNTLYGDSINALIAEYQNMYNELAKVKANASASIDDEVQKAKIEIINAVANYATSWEDFSS